jgi:choline dehydrogenase-like flavoprotein
VLPYFKNKAMSISANRCTAGQGRCRSSVIVQRTGPGLPAPWRRCSATWATRCRRIRTASGRMACSPPRSTSITGTVAAAPLWCTCRWTCARRSNLTIVTDTPFDKLVINDGRVEAVQFTRNGKANSCSPRQVIVCTGALQSPIVLMKSGIGPGAHLAEHGIAVQADHPGVGENQQEHPNIGVSGYVHASGRRPTREHHHLQSLLRYSSGLDGIPPGDMHVALAACGGWHAVGQRIGTLDVWVNRSHSTGRVRLSSSPDRSSDIDFRMLSDPRDMIRLKGAFRMGARAMLAAKQTACSCMGSRVAIRRASAS